MRLIRAHFGKLLMLGALALALGALPEGDASAQRRGRPARPPRPPRNPPTAVPELDPAGLAGALFVTIGGALVLVERRRRSQS